MKLPRRQGSLELVNWTGPSEEVSTSRKRVFLKSVLPSCGAGFIACPALVIWYFFLIHILTTINNIGIISLSFSTKFNKIQQKDCL